MGDEVDSDEPVRGPHQILSVIAKTLNVAPTAFSDPMSCDLGRASEVMRLWLTITDTPDQEKALAIVRTIASRA